MQFRFLVQFVLIFNSNWNKKLRTLTCFPQYTNMSVDTEYKDFGKHGSYRDFFEHGAFFTLKETIQEFFHCDATFYPKPTNQLKSHFNINIHDNPRRGFYPIDNNNIVIVGRILGARKMISAIGFHLQGERISENVKLLNKFEGALSGTFTQEFNNHFQYGSLAFGDELLKHTITNYICQGFYDFRSVRHLIEYFFKLRTTSFEGSFFSTGAILSKAIHDFMDKESTKRNGETFQLSNWIRIKNSNKIDKRIWYLADGKTSFFLGTKNLDFTHLFVLSSAYSNTNYLDSHSLSLTLKGGDALFKVENEKLFSINTSNGFEFLFFENQWKFRNYNFLKKVLQENITTEEAIIDSIIFYLLSCSKKQISSILWFPNDVAKIDELIQVKTKNTLLDSPVNVTNKDFINQIFRCLSSDGATIIDKQGNIVFIGVVIDLSKLTIHGLKGTGESAASALTSNGVSVKISQDGNIKIFTSKSEKPFIF
jgi:hypothetical protein